MALIHSNIVACTNKANSPHSNTTLLLCNPQDSLDLLESLESLDLLESLESLDLLESLESLDSLESLESLDLLEIRKTSITDSLVSHASFVPRNISPTNFVRYH